MNSQPPTDIVLEALLSSPLAVAVIDRELRYTQVSVALARLIERDANAMIGQTVRESNARFADQLEPALRRVLEDGSPIHNLELHGAESPSLRGWKIHLLPLRDPVAGIAGVIVTAEATTAQRETPQPVQTDPGERKHIRARLEALYRATSELISARTPPEVRAVMLNTALEALGADGGGLWLLADDGQTLELTVMSLGQRMTEESVQGFSSLAVTADQPATEALRTNKPVFITDLADFERRYPALGELARLHGTQANAHLPLRGPNSTFGVLSLNFDAAHAWDAIERTLALTFADRAAAAHERAVLDQALERNKLLLQRALEASQAGTWEYDPATREIVYDGTYGVLIGRASGPGAVNAAELEAFTLPEERERRGAAMRAALAGGVGSPFQTDYRLRVAGRERWVRSIGRVVSAEAGALRLAGTISDITEAHVLEERMRASEERLRLALEGNRMVTWEWTVATDEALTSDNFADVYGMDALGGVQQGLALVWPEDLEAHRALIERVSSQGGSYHNELRITRPSDGQMVWIEERAAALLGIDGRVERLIGVATDISERKATEERLRRNAETFTHLVHTAPFGIYVVDADFRVAVVSVGALPTFAGMSPLIGRDFAEVMQTIWTEPFASETISRFRHTLKTGESYVATITEQRGDITAVESYDWRIERVSLPDGRYGVVCYFHDVTKARATTQRLEEVNEAQRRFVSDAAHELRAPLTSIRGNLNLLRRYPNIADEERTEMLTDAEREANRLTRLIADLLSVARGQAREEIEPERVALEKLLEETWRGALSLSEFRRFELGLLEPLVMLGDPDALKQLFLILLENAVKYSPVDGLVRLEVMGRDEWAEVRVYNDGAGIAEADLERVFERFYRTDQARSRTNGASGTGLGLTIARQIVERHGGRIWFESADGQGTTAIVRLPRSV